MIATTISAALRLSATVIMFAVLTNILPLLTFQYIAQGLLVGQIISIFTDSGINTQILQYAGIEPIETHRNRIRQSIRARVTLAPLIGLIVFLVSLVLYDTTAAQLICLGALSAILAASAESVFVGLRATRQARMELIQSVIMLAAIVTLPLLALIDPAFAGLGLFVARGVILISTCSTVWPGHKEHSRVGLTLRELSLYYRPLKHYLTDSAFSNIGIRVDSILAVILLTGTTFALYQPASKLFYAGLGLAGLVGGVVIPAASRRPPARALLEMLVGFIVAGLIISMSLYILLVHAVGPIFGEPFQPTANTASLLSTICALRFFSAGFGAFLTHMSQQKRRAIISAMSLVIAVIGGAVLLISGDASIELILGLLLITQVFGLILFFIEATREVTNAQATN